MAELKRLGVTPIMLTGDNSATARTIAAHAGIDDAQGNLLPEDKLTAIKRLQQQYGMTGMTGDGINDAPALAQAGVGFTMGGAGTDTAMEAADVVIMNDDLRRIPGTIRLSRKTHGALAEHQPGARHQGGVHGAGAVRHRDDVDGGVCRHGLHAARRRQRVAANQGACILRNCSEPQRCSHTNRRLGRRHRSDGTLQMAVTIESQQMRRWMFAILLFVVPFQMVWASAAPYCAHETNIAAGKHFGHHEHRHQAGGEITSVLDDQGDESGAYHADCEMCHLGCTVAVSTQAATSCPVPSGAAGGCNELSYTSHVPSGPERPDRSEHNPAARFGGGVVFGSPTA